MSNERFNRTLGALAYAPRTLDSSGLVTIDLDSATDGALLLPDDGISITGIRINDLSGTDKTSAPNYHSFSVYVAALSGNTGTIVHMSGSVDDAYKIRVALSGATASVTGDKLFKLVYSTGEECWVAYDLGPVDLSSIPFTAANATHWANDTPPTSLQEAINRLAAALNQNPLTILGVGKP